MTNNKKKSTGQSGGDDSNAYKRNKRIEFLCSSIEYEKIKSKFEKSDANSLAKFCREQVLSNNVLTENKANSFHNEITFALSKIGNNLNQIARRLNTEKKEYSELLTELQSELEGIKSLQRRYKRGQ